jgi:hydroxyacylglutathione hydrolase
MFFIWHVCLLHRLEINFHNFYGMRGNMMGKIQLEIIPALDTNYIYAIHDEVTGATAVIDPGEALPVMEKLAEKNWKLSHVLCTHHHHDHVNGIAMLKKRTGCVVVGFAGDAARVPAIDIKIQDEARFRFGNIEVELYHIPGHTHGAVCYYLPSEKVAFTGDTLFTMGCGRVMEGTPAQMLHSLRRLVALLPDDVRVYSGHEYAHGNARFALSVDGENPHLLARFQKAADKLELHEPMQGGTMQEERLTNPFLRVHERAIRVSLGMLNATDEAVFAELRKRKDAF